MPTAAQAMGSSMAQTVAPRPGYFDVEGTVARVIERAPEPPEPDRLQQVVAGLAIFEVLVVSLALGQVLLVLIVLMIAGALLSRSMIFAGCVFSLVPRLLGAIFTLFAGLFRPFRRDSSPDALHPVVELVIRTDSGQPPLVHVFAKGKLAPHAPSEEIPVRLITRLAADRRRYLVRGEIQSGGAFLPLTLEASHAGRMWLMIFAGVNVTLGFLYFWLFSPR